VIATKKEKFGFGPKIGPYGKVVAGNRKRKASEIEKSNLTHRWAGWFARRHESLMNVEGSHKSRLEHKRAGWLE
jgi:hypothetical protein